MGIAEIIPGVSGGTIAFVSGIYEQLINAIKSFSPALLGVFRREGGGGVWQAVDGPFLALLMSGMALGIVIGVFGVSWFLENYPPLIWGFFFGLIVASIIYMGQQIDTWGAAQVVLFVVGAIGAYLITAIAPATGSDSLLFVFLCGMIAISALILPGISGSFMLLLLGMYQFIVQDTLKGLLTDFSMGRLLVLGVFAAGCTLGLMSISRVLSWTFKRYHAQTLAVLTGFLLGSLNKIYPWRNATDWLRDHAGQIVMQSDGVTPKKVLVETNVLPSSYHGDPLVIGVCLVCLLGFAAVFLFDRLGKKMD